MKPAWDQLMAEFEEDENIVIGDVDCDAPDGKPKCEEVGIKSYPTLKYGNPAALEEYTSKDRDFASLKEFADGLGPVCSATNLDACDEDKRKVIEEFAALTFEEREDLIDEKQAKIKKLEGDLEELMASLQKEYQEASEKRDAEVAAIKNSGLGLLKAVHAYERKKNPNIMWEQAEAAKREEAKKQFAEAEEAFEAEEEDPEGEIEEDPEGEL